MSTDFAWLIEAGPDAGGAYWWWNEGWVQDAWKAARFDTQDAAETAMRAKNLSARVVEHGFASGAEDSQASADEEGASDET